MFSFALHPNALNSQFQLFQPEVPVSSNDSNHRNQNEHHLWSHDTVLKRDYWKGSFQHSPSFYHMHTSSLLPALPAPRPTPPLPRCSLDRMMRAYPDHWPGSLRPLPPFPPLIGCTKIGSPAHAWATAAVSQAESQPSLCQPSSFRGPVTTGGTPQIQLTFSPRLFLSQLHHPRAQLARTFRLHSIPSTIRDPSF